MLTGWLRDVVTIAVGAAVLAVLMMTDARGGMAGSLTLSQEHGGEVGLLCQYMDTEHEPPPVEAADLCDDAAADVGRRVASAGKRLRHFGLRDMTDPDRSEPGQGGATVEPLPPVDGPTVLLVMEARRDWTAPGPSRLLLYVRTAREGTSLAVVGTPPVPVPIDRPDWRDDAAARVVRLMDFNLRN